MASGGVAALPPPRGSAANLGADAPAGGLSAPPINAVEAAPGPVTGSSAATVPGPSVKHRGDGPLSSVNSLVNDFASAADAHAYGESTQPRETVMEMWVPLAAVGSVIGSHGTVIKSLQLKSGAIIVVHNDVLDATASSKMITINGPPEAVTMAKTLVNEVVA
eukprot:contig_34822_g8365